MRCWISLFEGLLPQSFPRRLTVVVWKMRGRAQARGQTLEKRYIITYLIVCISNPTHGWQNEKV